MPRPLPLFAALNVAARLRARWQIWRGREDRRDLAERRAAPENLRADLWVHAASVGEIKAVRRTLEGLLEARPDLHLWITLTTVTGRDTARSWNLPSTNVTLAPDLGRRASARLIGSAGLCGLVVVENELWPARILPFHAAGLPVAMLNARIGARTTRGWQRIAPGLAREMLAPMRWIAPQDTASAERLKDLGAQRMLPPVNLKALAGDAPPDGPRQPVFVAASTHPGEEAVVIAAYMQARKTRPDLRLILAPRHPDRRGEVTALVREVGLSPALRSEGASVDAPVLLLDTLGELESIFASAAIAFLGGSLVPLGGHTPFEPVAAGCPVLTGPHTENFAEIYAALTAAGGAVVVRDADTLTAAILAHANDSAMADAARAALPRPDTGAVNAALRTLI